jgi:hypothetical protein
LGGQGELAIIPRTALWEIADIIEKRSFRKREVELTLRKNTSQVPRAWLAETAPLSALSTASTSKVNSLIKPIVSLVLRLIYRHAPKE